MMEFNKTIEITASCVAAGKRQKAGAVITVKEGEARQLISLKRAKEATAPKKKSFKKAAK